MAAGAMSLAASTDDLPASSKEADLEATRLGAGQLASHIKQAAELLVRGELDPSHPWPAALLWRRVRDLHSIEAVAADDVLAPLVRAPGADGVLRATAAKDPSGKLALLADALAPDWRDSVRPAGGLTTDEIVAKHAGVSTEEVAHYRRERRLRRVGAGLPPEPTEAELAGYQSRRRLQTRRRRVTSYVARLDNTPAPPQGKGRWPGSRGKRTMQRRCELAALWPKLSADERRPAALAKRLGVSLATAKRDAAAIRTGSI
jgi:hypothetical protein